MNKINFLDNINCIKEIYPGTYRIVLDFATTNILPYLIKDNYHYIWVHNHTTGKGYDWEEFSLPIQNNLTNLKTLARSLTFDFILNTQEFKEMMHNWKGGVELIQLNKIPPYYLDLKKVQGKQRYELLEKECDYLFELDIPSATDYGVIISHSKDYLQSLLDHAEINWEALP